MNYDATLVNYFFHAGIVVKMVMLILFCASIVSWAYILQRTTYYNQLNKAAKQFEHAFWSGEDLSRLYHSTQHKETLQGLEAIFQAGYKEFLLFRQNAPAYREGMLDNTQRAMVAAQIREQNKLENHLPFLAIVGSTAPYVGLLGTVWGIMQAFQAMANVQQATIAMVAPGLAEALIATAFGLFAAIPAVIFYNRFITTIGRLMNRFDAFKEEFVNILLRQSQNQPMSSVKPNPGE